jgi:ferredoxin-NADP reductase
MTASLYKGKLIERIKRTPSVESFRFQLDGACEFLPGQFLCVMFDANDEKNKELNKYLSFSSSPLKGYVEVTKRLSDSEFSKNLNALKPHDEVILKGPLGSCVYKDEYSRIAFVIGGIGITPVISIIEYIVERKLCTDVKVFYSNRVEEEIAFKKELDAWSEANPNIQVFFSVTDCAPQDPRCYYGRIDTDLLVPNLTQKEDRIVYLFGPPGMVKAMQGLCSVIGCPNDKVKIEHFIGY